jgi:hypothetical protein
MYQKPKKEFNTYNIKAGDTLKSIATFLNKTEWEVAGFHNCYAKHLELIGVEFPKDLKHLYITPDVSAKHIEGIPKVQFLYDRKLKLTPFKHVLLYDIKQQISIGKEIKTRNYKVSVRLKEQKADLFLFEINIITTPEQEELNSILEELSAEVYKALYPLELVVNDYGNWIGIHDFKAIYSKWLNIQNDILDEFDGDDIKKRLAYYNTLFQDEKRLTNLLQKDIFLNTYFNGLYTNHTQGCYFESTIQFPVLPNVANVNYKVVQEIEEYLNKYNLIAIEQQGKIVDRRSYLDYQYELDEPCYNSNIPGGNYKANYLLNSKYNYIKKANLSCSIHLDAVKEIKMSIELIEQ